MFERITKILWGDLDVEKTTEHVKIEKGRIEHANDKGTVNSNNC